MKQKLAHRCSQQQVGEKYKLRTMFLEHLSKQKKKGVKNTMCAIDGDQASLKRISLDAVCWRIL